MKMLHVCRAAHVLWVIWNAEYDGGIHLRLDLRKGQYKVKLGQKSSNFHNQNCHLKTCLSCPVLSQDSRNVIFLRTAIRNVKNCI